VSWTGFQDQELRLLEMDHSGQHLLCSSLYVFHVGKEVFPPPQAETRDDAGGRGNIGSDCLGLNG
jgi:hypothetical protein